MSIKMIFAYTLLLNGLIFIGYGVQFKENELSISPPKMTYEVLDAVPIILIKEVESNVLISK